MTIINSKSSLVKVRNLILQRISGSKDIGSINKYDYLIASGSLSARWILLQLLAGHPDPKKVLFLGATLGGDIIGACKQGHQVVVLDPNKLALSLLEQMVSEPEYICLGPSQQRDVGKFDIVYLTPWWIHEALNQNINIKEVLLQAMVSLNSTGKLIIHSHFSKPIPKTAAKLLAGMSFMDWYNLAFPSLSIKQLKLIVNSEPYRTSSFLLTSNPLAPLRVLAKNTPTRQFARLVFEKDYTLLEKIRCLPLILYSSIGLPIEKIFPWQLLVISKSCGTDESNYKINWAKVSGRVVTSIGQENDESYYVRHSTGQTANQNEINLLIFLEKQSQVSNFVQAPVSIQNFTGVRSAFYKFTPGSVLPQNKSTQFADQIISFLHLLSQIKSPEYLESAYFRLGRYLSRWLLHYQNKPKEDFILQAQTALARLHNQNVFRWITHGELRCGNIRLTSKTEQLKVVDWVQCYKGHPLLDWWMFIYWEGAPKNNYHVPQKLTMGLDNKAICDLWLVWKAAYNR